MKYSYLIALFAVAAGCKNNNANPSGFVPTNVVQTFSKLTPATINNHEDGTYCAVVEYYNSRTGANRTYALSVEIKNKELVQIKWPNGGWLDDSHFNVQASDDGGSVTLVSDRANNYKVTINNDGPCASGSSMLVEDQLRGDTYSNEDEGHVIWAQSECKYAVMYIGGWYVVANKSYAFLSNGDHIRGNFETFGYQNLYNVSNSQKEKVYIDNYYESKAEAMKKVMENCGLHGKKE